MLNENYKSRIKLLAGIISEDTVTLTAPSGGRSDVDTLSWYIEEYLLKIGSSIVTTLDNSIEKHPSFKLYLSRESTKVMPNTLVIKLIIEGNQIKEEFLLTLSVNFESNSNTVCAIRFKGITNKFNLGSKHSLKDLKLFKLEVIENIINSVTLLSKN